MNSIIFLSQELLAFLKRSHYKESTLAKYERELKVLQRFCENHGSSNYTIELGNEYAQISILMVTLAYMIIPAVGE